MTPPAWTVPQLNDLLINDALHSVARLPVSAESWQRLCRVAASAASPTLASLVADIEALELPDRHANWLRFSALSYLTGNADYFVKQAVFAGTSFPADVVMTFLGLVWHHALTKRPVHQDFIRLLQDVSAVQLQRNVASAWPALKKAARSRSNRLRIAIYTPQIISPHHGGTLFTLNMMSVVAKLGMECEAFAAQEVVVALESTYRGCPEHLTSPVTIVESLVLNTDAQIRLLTANVDYSLDARYLEIRQAIDSYSPDVVLFIGLFSPLLHDLYTRYPVVGLNVHALPPLAPVDIWLSADETADTKVWSNLPVPRLQHFPFRFWPPRQEMAVPVNRQQWQAGDTAVVMVTVGYRLHHEMPENWLHELQAFLMKHTEVHWLLIGLAPALWPPGLLIHDRIHLVPPQTELDRYLAASDIYLNPPRAGGGGSVAMAMALGLPVLTMSGSDAADKVRSMAATSLEDYFERLAVWVNNASVRRQAGEQLKREFGARLDVSSDSAQNGFLQACEAALSSFSLRQARTND